MNIYTVKFFDPICDREVVFSIVAVNRVDAEIKTELRLLRIFSKKEFKNLKIDYIKYQPNE